MSRVQWGAHLLCTSIASESVFLAIECFFRYVVLMPQPNSFSNRCCKWNFDIPDILAIYASVAVLVNTKTNIRKWLKGRQLRLPCTTVASGMLVFLCEEMLGQLRPSKIWKSHCCVPLTATFSKRRKIGASWSERCDAHYRFGGPWGQTLLCTSIASESALGKRDT